MSAQPTRRQMRKARKGVEWHVREGNMERGDRPGTYRLTARGNALAQWIKAKGTEDEFKEFWDTGEAPDRVLTDAQLAVIEQWAGHR